MYPSLQHRPRCPAIMNSFIVEDYASQLHWGLFLNRHFWNPVSYNSTMEDNFRVFERTLSGSLSGVSISELRNLWTNGMPLGDWWKMGSLRLRMEVESRDFWCVLRVVYLLKKRFWILDVEIVELKASILHEENATKQPTKDTKASKNGPPVQWFGGW